MYCCCSGFSLLATTSLPPPLPLGLRRKDDKYSSAARPTHTVMCSRSYSSRSIHLQNPNRSVRRLLAYGRSWRPAEPARPSPSKQSRILCWLLGRRTPATSPAAVQPPVQEHMCVKADRLQDSIRASANFFIVPPTYYFPLASLFFEYCFSG